jgi:hypothetical protein
MRHRGAPADEAPSRPESDERGRRRRDPLLGIERLVVDGTNVVYALGAGHGAAPSTFLVGRLRSVVPAPIAIDLVFDGPPAPGLGRRIGPGLTVHHAADRSADDLIVGLVATVGQRLRRADPGSARIDRAGPPRASGSARASGSPSSAGRRPDPGSPPAVLVVTDDADLRRRVRLLGAATVPTSWLAARLARPRLAGPAAGNRRAPARPDGRPFPGSPASAEADEADDTGERVPWRPGRGATTKRGNPRRRRRRGLDRG